MRKTSSRKTQQVPDPEFCFGPGFLLDHAGQIIEDPKVALIELVANAYDAGATRVEVNWPREHGSPLNISDNGTGMTRAEFEHRWRSLSYKRLDEQGEMVVFPPGVREIERRAFGSYGKGRHGAFSFNDNYTVETWKDGKRTKAIVQTARNQTEPFHCEVIEETDKPGHGTSIYTVGKSHILLEADVRELLGSKFLVDPSFEIILNGAKLELLKLGNIATKELELKGLGKLIVHQIDANINDRTTRLRGITWWFNGRMIGDPSWEGLDGEGNYLDGRTAEAKRFTFIAVGDSVLRKEDIKQDWKGFHATQRSNAARAKLHEFVVQSLRTAMADTRKERKKAALQRHQELLGGMTPVSRKVVGEFVDAVQDNCPNISPRDLTRTAEIFAKMEQNRSGYDLLKQLAACSPSDLDTWNYLMQQWSARDAEIVLGELQRRLRLIERLQELVNASTANELHDLQPLFERGLWIFGPEYEAVDFRSNRGMAEIVGKFLGGTTAPLPRKRPDFVALPDRSIGVYGAAKYGDNGEISGIRQILIVELKKGGFKLEQKELDQARDYAKVLRTGNHVDANATVIAYVLGATLESGLEHMHIGDNTHILPMMYNTVLEKAHSRTFHLQKKIEEAHQVVTDPDVEEVVKIDETLLPVSSDA